MPERILLLLFLVPYRAPAADPPGRHRRGGALGFLPPAQPDLHCLHLQDDSIQTLHLLRRRDLLRAPLRRLQRHRRRPEPQQENLHFLRPLHRLRLIQRRRPRQRILPGIRQQPQGLHRPETHYLWPIPRPRRRLSDFPEIRSEEEKWVASRIPNGHEGEDQNGRV